MKKGEFFGLILIWMGNAIRSKKNTLKTVFDQSIPLGKVKIENHRIVLFDSANEAS